VRGPTPIPHRFTRPRRVAAPRSIGRAQGRVGDAAGPISRLHGRCAPRRHGIAHVRSYPAVDAARVHASPPPPDAAEPGSRSYLDFAVVTEEAGIHTVTVVYDHAAEVPLALGFALDRAQTRTVSYPPLAAGATRRSTTLDLRMRRGPAVIRVAEGPAGAPLRVHSIRITGRGGGSEPAVVARPGAVRPDRAPTAPTPAPRTGAGSRPRPRSAAAMVRGTRAAYPRNSPGRSPVAGDVMRSRRSATARRHHVFTPGLRPEQGGLGAGPGTRSRAGRARARCPRPGPGIRTARRRSRLPPALPAP